MFKSSSAAGPIMMSFKDTASDSVTKEEKPGGGAGLHQGFFVSWGWESLRSLAASRLVLQLPARLLKLNMTKTQFMGSLSPPPTPILL